jgi:hypothetical protein
MRGVPAGFAACREGGGRWLAEAARLDALRAAGLLDRRGIEAVLAAGSGARGRGRTAIVSLAACELVLRPLRRGGALGPWLGSALPGPARPLDEIAVTAALRAAGAPVPRPVLAGAWRQGPVWGGVVATEREAGAVDAEHWLQAAADPALRRVAAVCAGVAVRRFHDAGGSHPDLHVKNLLVRERDAAAEVLVIDLDRARIVASLDARARMAQLMRLYRSLRKRDLLDRIGLRDRVAFFRAYVAGDRSLRRGLLERLPHEQRRVALHALRYRRG